MCEDNYIINHPETKLSCFDNPIKKVRYEDKNSGNFKELYYKKSIDIYKKTQIINYDEVSKTDWKYIERSEYKLICKNANIPSDNYTKKCISGTSIHPIEGDPINITKEEYDSV